MGEKVMDEKRRYLPCPRIRKAIWKTYISGTLWTGDDSVFPPTKQEKATQTVLEQAEVLCRDWALM